MELSTGLMRYCAAVMQTVDGEATKDGDKTTVQLRDMETVCIYTINSKKIHVQMSGQNTSQDYSIERVGDNYACSFRVSSNSRSPRKMQRVVNERNAAEKFREWITSEFPIV